MVKIRCSALVLYGVGRKNLSENTIPQVLASAVPFSPISLSDMNLMRSHLLHSHFSYIEIFL